MFDDPDIILRFCLFVLVPVLLALALWYWAGPSRRGPRSRRRGGGEASTGTVSPVAPRRAVEGPSVPVPIILDRRDEAGIAEREELAQRDRTLAEMSQRFDKVVGERNALAEQLGAATQRVRKLEFEADELRTALGAVRAEVAERDEEIERLRLHEKALEALRRDKRSHGRELVALGPTDDYALPPEDPSPSAGVASESETVMVMAEEPLLRRDREPGDGSALTPAVLARSAMRFDGTTGNQVAETAFEGLSGAGFTIEMWVRPRAHPHSGTLLSYVAGRKGQVGLYVRPDGTLDLSVGGVGGGVGAAVPLELDAWQHLAVCWEAETGGFSIYIDGEELFAGEISRGALIPTGGRLLIGQDANPLWDEATPEMSFVGDIAEVRIWRYVREGAAISLDQGRRARGGPGVTIWRVVAG